MSTMATWGPMSLLVSSTKIAVLEGLTTSLVLKEDSENDTSGTNPTNTRGRELQSVTFTVKYLAAAGVDPRSEVAKWEAELGNYYPLMIGGERFGPEYLKLKQVAQSDVLLSNTGKFLQIVAGITLEEYSEGKTSKLLEESAGGTTTTTTTSGTVAVDFFGVVDERIINNTERDAKLDALIQAAMNATPTAGDRSHILSASLNSGSAGGGGRATFSLWDGGHTSLIGKGGLR